MKVGKAIYNILSQSTDVQSNFPFNTTDYSPTGTELVTNGDFSAGVEQLTQPIDLTVDFSGNSGGVIDDSNSFTTSGGAVDGIRNKIGTFDLVDGKSYKLVIEGSTTSSGFTIGNINLGNEYGTGFGTHYFVATGTYSTTLWIRQQTAGTTDLTTFTIEELGEGWTTGATTSIGEDKATFTASGIAQALIQTNLWTADSFSGKTIKLTYTILANDLNVTLFRIGQYSSASAFSITDLNSSVGTHTIYVNVRSSAGTDNAIDFYIQSSATTGSLSITNISVEEMVLNKIFPELAPPDIDAPYIVYSVVSNSPSETKNTNGDIDTASIEVYGFQDTYNKAVDLGVSVRAALDRKTGTYNTIEIQSTNYVNEQMDVNEARKLWAAIQDYSIRIKNL